MFTDNIRVMDVEIRVFIRVNWVLLLLHLLVGFSST